MNFMLLIFFSIVKNGLGVAICLGGVLFFVIYSHLKLHHIKDPEPAKSMKKFFVHFIFLMFTSIAFFSFLSQIERHNLPILHAHSIHFVSILFFSVILPKYFIRQNPNLNLYVSIYHHQPPPVLPWELENNFDLGSVKLDVAKMK